ncbi:MAG: hypothetical protein H6865_03395 [Rhodospirillales bacterium]|nr:hypothetical protein [Alphaproteobacteria bacterium]MCB9986661.1 hypothetical protein [Rhodospirillales bacterium]USO06811.1 MAG: hypothetical protein H6866_04990 [Rhodospirillales bacterium]
MRMMTAPTQETITWFTPDQSAAYAAQGGKKTGAAQGGKTIDATQNDGKTFAMVLAQAESATPASIPAIVPTTPTPALAVHHNRFSVQRTAGTLPVFTPKAEAASFAPQAVPTKVEAGQRLGLGDLIDIVNPLQHIPFVAAAYRKITGDTISPAAQFIGATLYGGPLGAAAAMGDIAIREYTGAGLGDRAIAALSGKSAPATPAVMAARWDEPARMAGTMPVWSDETTRLAQSTQTPGTASETAFNTLVQSLSA